MVSETSNSSEKPATNAAADDAAAQDSPHGKEASRGAFQLFREAVSSGNKGGMRGAADVNLNEKTPDAIELGLLEQARDHANIDIGDAIAQLNDFMKMAAKLSARVGDIANSQISGGIGSQNFTLNLNTTPSTQEPSRSPPESGTTPLSWPASAFAACSNSPEQISFLLSAAIFDGHSISTVRHAASLLEKRLGNESKQTVEPTGGTPQTMPRISSLDGLFDQFRLKIQNETQNSGVPANCLRFHTPNDATSILLHAWTLVSGFPNWYEHIGGWLDDLGRNDARAIRMAAGAAAGLLWASGNDAIGTKTLQIWYSAESTQPLDALDACFSAAAVASPSRKQEIAKKLWAWGNITYGTDDVFALRHVSTRLYAQIDPDACCTSLGALLEKNNLLGLLHAQDAFERLFVTAIEVPENGTRISKTLFDVLQRGRKNKRGDVVLQVCLVVLSLLGSTRRDRSTPYSQKFYVIDRVLEHTDGESLARLVNSSMNRSPLQTDLLKSLRAMYLRGIRESKSANSLEAAPLRFIATLCKTANADERERLSYYLDDWRRAAAELSERAEITADHFETVIRGAKI